VLFIIIVARAKYFDNWPTRYGLIGVHSHHCDTDHLHNCSLAGSPKLNREVLEYLDARSFHAEISGNVQDLAFLKRAHGKITQEGIFGNWMECPIWKALLYPSGGYSLLTILDFVAGH